MKKLRLFISSLMIVLFVCSASAGMTEKEFLAQEELGRQKALALQKVCNELQAAAAANQRLASSVKVTNSATQQQQTHYQQLATFNNQKAKDIQQQEKDLQQANKDKQQLACDKAQKDTALKQTALEKQLKDKEVALAQREAAAVQVVADCQNNEVVHAPTANSWKDDGKGGFFKDQCGERWTHNSTGTFIDGIPLEVAFKLKGEAAYLCEEDYVGFKEEYKKKHINRSGGGDGSNPGGGGNINGFLNPGHLNHVANGQDDKATGVPVSK